MGSLTKMPTQIVIYLKNRSNHVILIGKLYFCELRRKVDTMTVDVRWYDDDKHILYYNFQGQWTWDEYFNALAEGRGSHAQCRA